ncbi:MULTISPECIES: hypothetical protein [unclassified Streptomyces]|uniref:hypothetical protein n=1 Tax=Streptomyces TaxID=1883 RepID=UPI0013E29406|nr:MULTISPECIES: hypothetical protein [unclassified Streptomyces]UQA38362.1 hypothetical protein KRR37_05400 [Streptomyces sp. HNA39]
MAFEQGPGDRGLAVDASADPLERGHVGVDGRSSTLISPEEVPDPSFGIASGASTAA